MKHTTLVYRGGREDGREEQNDEQLESINCVPSCHITSIGTVASLYVPKCYDKNKNAVIYECGQPIPLTDAAQQAMKLNRPVKISDIPPVSP